MITEQFYNSIGLNAKQTEEIQKALSQEQHFKDVLKKAGVHHIAVDKIAAKTDISKLNGIDDDTLTEMIKNEWADFITHKTGR